MDIGRRRAAGAVPRAALGSRSARRAGVSLRAGRERVLRPPRPDIAGAARPRPRGDRDLSGSHRLSGTVEPGRGCAALRCRRPGGRRSRRHGSHRRASRHRRRSLAPVPPETCPLRPRCDRSGKRRDRAAASDDPRASRAPRDGARGHRRRDGRAWRAARDRPRRGDPPRSRRRLAAELRGRVQRLLADRPDPRGTRGSRRSERRR